MRFLHPGFTSLQITSKPGRKKRVQATSLKCFPGSTARDNTIVDPGQTPKSCVFRGDTLVSYPRARFKCTSNNEIAAGVMPGMRVAMPMVSGRTFVNLSRTSFDKPTISL